MVYSEGTSGPEIENEWFVCGLFVLKNKLEQTVLGTKSPDTLHTTVQNFTC